MKIISQKRYQLIEREILSFRDVAKIKEIDANYDKEKFVKLPIYMTAVDQNIFVRETIAKKLLYANNNLQKTNPNLRIVVLEGYRSLKKQKEQFKKVFEKLKIENPDLAEIELYENAHKQIAVPKVAGHPTGGAVDVCIFDRQTNKMLDFGTQWKEFGAGKKNYTFSPEVSKAAIKNRKLLKRIMEQKGFYQYPAEWWHFSYGDKEWAVANNKPKALYQQIELRNTL